MEPVIVSRTVDLAGVLQGIGFRPTVYRLARAARLGGWVQNRSGSVRLVLEGPADTVAAFLRELPARLPPHARLEAVTLVAEEPCPRWNPDGFEIRASDAEDEPDILIPAELVRLHRDRLFVLPNYTDPAYLVNFAENWIGEQIACPYGAHRSRNRRGVR